MATKIRCHYEVLGVERSADNDDLKKAYRKLALKFHPDKNPDSVEEATAQFRLVQQAYEILTDPQERAWYDRHREAILRGGQGKGDKYEDNSLNLFQYFTSSCYSGFGDDEKGFYSVYREVFKTVSSEDYEFMDNKDSDFSFPEFGDSQSDYDEVVKAFYDFWHAFCTSKSYVWMEEYDTREAPDRRTRRLMEAENKKKRDAAKKERNEEIRALVAFVRKRDKRVQEHRKRLEERAAEIEKKTKEKREKELQERHKRRENYKETGWSATSGLEDDIQKLEAELAKQFGDHTDDDSDDDDDADDTAAAANGDMATQIEEEEYFDSLFCPACNKAFKSEKAMHNHEKSKKHKEMVAILRAELEQDEEMLEEMDDLENSLNEEELNGGEEGGGSLDEQTDTADRLTSEQQKEVEVDGIDREEEEEEEEEYVSRAKSKKQKKKRKQKLQEEKEDKVDSLANSITQLQVNADTQDDQETFGKRNAKSKKNRRKDKKGADASSPVDQVTKEPAEVAEEEQTATKEEEKEKKAEGQTADMDDVSQIKSYSTELSSQQPEGTDRVKPKPSAQNTKPFKVKDSQKCLVCNEAFPSRSKLFDHIKSSGHAAPLSAKMEASRADAVDTGKKKKKKGKQ